MHYTVSASIRALALVGSLSAVPANAAAVGFSGTQSYINVLNPPGAGRCAPNTTVDIRPGNLSSTGTSNLGAFMSTQSHCLLGQAPPASIYDGNFSFAFDAGDTLIGTYTGLIGFSGTPGLDFDLVEDFIVTGGTGRFLNAAGTFTLAGSLVRYENPAGPGFVADFTGRFDGMLDLAAVPEPATWGMMLLGFGAVGWTTRRRRPAQDAASAEEVGFEPTDGLPRRRFSSLRRTTLS